MPLNYSKWDQLEVSDDSDIEGHPNVDHKSLVRWRQRDIHEKREARKVKIVQLQANIDCDDILLPRVSEMAEKLADPSTDQIPYFNSLVEKLEKNPSKDCPPGNDPSKPEQTYDGMLLHLLRGVTDAVKKRVQASNVSESEKDAKLGKELATEMAMHVTQLTKAIDDKKKELEDELKEQKKKITSDDIHEGFDSKYVAPKPAPEPIPLTKNKNKKKETTYEVLNPGPSSPAPAPETSPEPEDLSEGEAELPQLTPSLEAFSNIRLREYEKSFEFIQHHRDVYVPGASDALLVAAFTAESEGKKKYAKQCVHQSLLLQYSEKLGRDGLGVFFKKMISGDKRAETVFLEDLEKTYNHLAERVKITQAEASSGKEQIQLVAEDPSMSISFNVPDGPPPENLKLEGPGTEDLDVEQVRQALQMRWDIFTSFPDNLQNALKIGKLEKVNQVLGDMDVQEAEDVVQKLDMAGILSFSEKGIRDITGRGEEDVLD
ncbi:hsp90-like protein [Macrolepiota fuliginosa MF-IS2]|uniref:Hsp90 chaperone protein kinase-targeting subunit n=1 Tax=Macrolepiota fuliginosa MF-IS2 TaxID=1400762 RepID=A0A9P5XIV6_9AGAR|nr:hsp90-like protein [Macrolepiota fuliginosa MF-IS2]